MDTPFQIGLEGVPIGWRVVGEAIALRASPRKYQHGSHAKVRMPGLAVEPGPAASKCAVRAATLAR